MGWKPEPNAVCTRAAWLLFSYLFPTKACGFCAGHSDPCPRCHGTGRRFRLGAKTARRMGLALLRAWQERNGS
jgi:hypothetical protein